MSFAHDLDTRLLRLSNADYFTLRDACQGVQVFGGIGSGKTSGSGRALASAYLRAGMGGLVLCAKPEEVELWQRYARENGRANSVMLFGDGHGCFNFLDYELKRQGPDGLGSVVECLMRLLEAARLSKGDGGKSEPFWEDATRQLLRNSIPIIQAATGTVAIPDIIRFVGSAPVSVEQAQTAEWQGGSFMFQAMLAARERPVAPLSADDFQKISAYWRYEFAQLDPKTRGNIAITLSTALDRFNRGRLHRAFCGQTNLVPELTFHGAIIVMDMSALTWNEDGVIGQQLFKYMWQRAVLARNALPPRHRQRPVFLWADEAQYFVNSYDADFLSTCRSSRACAVYLTQSLPTYYARMGGPHPQHAADMLLANFQTRVFHNNACAVTNRWASDTIGRSLQRRYSENEGASSNWSRGMNAGAGESAGSSSSFGGSSSQQGSSSSWSVGSNRGSSDNWGRNRGSGGGSSYSTGYSEAMEVEIEPAAFARDLVTGGPANGGKVTGLWLSAGRRFADSGRNYLHVAFRQ